jgi:predicted phosphodiesterase
MKISNHIFLYLFLVFISGCDSQLFRQSRAVRKSALYYFKNNEGLIDTGPVIANAGCNYFVVSVKTDDRAKVVVKYNEKEQISSGRKYHALTIGHLKPDTLYKYEIEFISEEELTGKDSHAHAGPYYVKTLPAEPPLKFAVYGDPQADKKNWALISTLILKENPDFVLGLGDYVNTGPADSEWREGYFPPAKNMLSCIPHFAVAGNHDEGADKWMALLNAPSGMKNWTFESAGVRVIGLNIIEEWSRESENLKWFESCLSRSSEKFIFVALHAGPYSSHKHGEGSDNPHDRLFKKCRKFILPICEKYNVTAILSGHVHAYERCELPGGITSITSGGAGARLYSSSHYSEKFNPYSIIYKKLHHFLIIESNGSNCTLKAIDAKENIIDTKQWTVK